MILERINLAITALIIVLMIYFYKGDITPYLNTKKCFRLPCKEFYFLVILTIIILEDVHLSSIISIDPFLSLKIPKISWLISIFLSFGILGVYYNLREPINDDGSNNFHPMPNNIIRRKNRTKLLKIILFLLLCSITIYFITLKKNNYILGPLFKLSNLVRLVNPILLGILIIFHDNFAACKYDLPINWNR